MTASLPETLPISLPDGLLDPRAFRHRADRVELVTTHISWVFLAGDFVYKVKRPVDLGFVDFSTLERRRHFCEEEVRLSRPLAGDTCLGVVPIVRTPSGALAVGGSGEVVDYAVHMWRLPRQRMMDQLLERGAFTNASLERLVERLASFHASAPRDPEVAAFGTRAEVSRLADENLLALEPCAGTRKTGASSGTLVVSPTLLWHLRRRTRSFLDVRAALFDRRVAGGFIREGHGDLHTSNICFALEDLVIYDRIEFSRALRCCDVAADIAFLAMDLDLQGYRGFSGLLARRYAEVTRDRDLEELMPFYKTYRALVRAKVASLRARDERAGAETRETARREAMRYAQLAGSYTLPPSLVLMCGLPGTGKSFLAAGMAAPFEAAVIRSDVVRKRQAGLPPSRSGKAPWQKGLYTPGSSARAYAALLEETRDLLAGGRTVIVDASFLEAERRRPFLDLARDMAMPCVLARVDVPERVARQRLQEREEAGYAVSDADFAVYQEARQTMEPPDEVPQEQCLQLDGRVCREDAAAELLDRLVNLVSPSSRRDDHA